ncbi:MAG: ABC transporter permease [Acidimicrobiales bacterium]
MTGPGGLPGRPAPEHSRPGRPAPEHSRPGRTARSLHWLLWNPIVAKELRSRMRTWRAPAVLVGYLALVGLVGYLTYDLAGRSGPGVLGLGQVGMDVFVVLAAAVLALLTLLVPGLVGGTVSGERERQTLDLLLCTPVRPARIVVGKLVSALLFVVVLLAASVPLFSAALLLGGVSLPEILVMLLVSLVTVAVIGALSMLCSVGLRRTTSSTVSSYLATFLLFVLPLLLGAVASTAATGSVTGNPVPFGRVAPLSTTPPRPHNGPPLIELFSPATAVVATLRADANTPAACGGPFPGPCFVGGTGVPQTSDVRAGVAFSGWQEWEVFVLFDGCLALLLVAASAAVLSGRVPRRQGGPPPDPVLAPDQAGTA